MEVENKSKKKLGLSPEVDFPFALINPLRKSRRKSNRFRTRDQQTKGSNGVQLTSHVEKGTQHQRPESSIITVTWRVPPSKVGNNDVGEIVI